MGIERKSNSLWFKRSSKMGRAVERVAPVLEAMEDRKLMSASPLFPNQAVSEQVINFRVDASVADTARNVVYIVDGTHQALLAINTDSGALIGKVTLNAPGTGVAVALADDKLYVSEPSKTQIEVFSLPALASTGTLPLSTAVNGIVAGAANRIYGVTAAKSVVQIDSSTGTQLSTVASGFAGVPLLKTNLADTHLYILDQGGAAGGSIPEYNITTGALPSLITTYTANLAGARSFSINEPSNQIYVINSGVNGIGVVNTTNNTEAIWSFGGPVGGAGVAFLQGVSHVYGASSGPGDATIIQYDLSGNATSAYALDNYSTVPGFLTTDPNSLLITPNGNVVFTANASSGPGGELGIVGIGQVNVASPVATFTYANTGGRNYTFNGSGSTAPAGQTITSWNWDFGDGSTGSGASTFHNYASNGTYAVKLTVTASGGMTDTATQQVTVLYKSPTPTPTPTPSGTGILGGVAYNDANANGVKNRHEGFIRGFTVFLDTNQNGRADVGEKVTTTGYRGTFLFTNLPAGSYTIGIIKPAGWVQTAPSRDQEVVLSVGNGTSDTSALFGIYHKSNVAAVAPPVTTAPPVLPNGNGVYSMLHSVYSLPATTIKRSVLA